MIAIISQVVPSVLFFVEKRRLSVAEMATRAKEKIRSFPHPISPTSDRSFEDVNQASAYKISRDRQYMHIERIDDCDPPGRSCRGRDVPSTCLPHAMIFSIVKRRSTIALRRQQLNFGTFPTNQTTLAHETLGNSRSNSFPTRLDMPSLLEAQTYTSDLQPDGTSVLCISEKTSTIDSKIGSGRASYE